MKTTVLAVCLLHITVANTNHELFVDNQGKYKTYQLDVPGKDPITIVENRPLNDDDLSKWDIVDTTKENDAEIKNLMTHIIHDIHNNKPRCYGPSCQEGFLENEGPQENFDGYIVDNVDKLKDYKDFPNERLQAIAALAAKLKKLKNKSDRFPATSSQDYDNEDKVYTSWNRLKVKQHKHPYDDKDGWVTLEPVAWSTSKISKWKPNVKKQKPTHWNDDDDEDTKFTNDNRFTSHQDSENSYVYPQKRPTMTRPGYINNKLHIPQEFESEIPSKPSWIKNKPQQGMQSFQSSWSSDDSRRPYKPNCDKEEDYPSDEAVYYGMSDSVVTDNRPANFPYEYEALHQASSQKRPLRRPTQVVYADTGDYYNDHTSRPPYGDGQWVLLSTTKGYRNKKRQRSLSLSEENVEVPSITSHRAVSLTVLPVDDNSKINMTTSHGGMLEVEKSFQTVDESKRDMDLKNDLEASESQLRPVRKVLRKKIIGNKNTPDSSTVLTAVGAGMVPATMAMVVPMMLGRRRRDVNFVSFTPQTHLDHILHRN